MPEVKSVSAEDFDQEVLQSDLPVLVDLWAPWCAPCLMVAPIVEKVAEKYAGRLKVVKVNVDEAPEIANRYSVRAIPTLLLFKSGELVGRMIGAQPESAISSAVEAIL